MTAGSGSSRWQEARELEKLMVATFGPDFRDKAVASPMGSWRLEDAFVECGLTDPHPSAQRSSGAYGLWQITMSTGR